METLAEMAERGMRESGLIVTRSFLQQETLSEEDGEAQANARTFVTVEFQPQNGTTFWVDIDIRGADPSMGYEHFKVRFVDPAASVMRARFDACNISVHASDCAVHNAPAFPVGPCDCKPCPDCGQTTGHYDDCPIGMGVTPT